MSIEEHEDTKQHMMMQHTDHARSTPGAHENMAGLMQNDGNDTCQPNTKMPNEIMWIVLEELLGAHSTGMVREQDKSLTLYNFEMVDEEHKLNMSYLRISKSLKAILESIFSRAKLVYDADMRRRYDYEHPLGRQLLSAGKSLVGSVRELVVHCRPANTINNGILGGLVMIMEDRGIDVLSALLENASKPIAYLVLTSGVQNASPKLRNVRRLQGEIYARWTYTVYGVDGTEPQQRSDRSHMDSVQAIRWSPSVEWQYEQKAGQLWTLSPSQRVDTCGIVQFDEEQARAGPEVHEKLFKILKACPKRRR